MIKAVVSGIYSFFSGSGDPKGKTPLGSGRVEKAPAAFSEFTDREINALQAFLKSPKISDADKKIHQALFDKIITNLKFTNKDRFVLTEEEISSLQNFLESKNRSDLTAKLRGTTSLNFHIVC